jgi:hypothetical protein
VASGWPMSKTSPSTQTRTDSSMSRPSRNFSSAGIASVCRFGREPVHNDDVRGVLTPDADTARVHTLRLLRSRPRSAPS